MSGKPNPWGLLRFPGYSLNEGYGIKIQGIEAAQKGYSDQRARDADIRLAQRAINGNAPGLLHNALCSSDQLEIARIRGSINKIQVAIGHIVSFLHLETTVQKYTVGNG
ncbi:hypothetical protein PAV_11c01510 [Paenibacillus alvei DSM 29]|nr:hypothetical protein PAV_11c01510 [Paenibacillus alvei DSM 29]